jgi:hypothetical protein
VSRTFRFLIEMPTHRFQIRNAFPCCPARLRAKQPFLLEDKTRTDEETTDNGEDNPNDLIHNQIQIRTPVRAADEMNETWVMTLRFPLPAEIEASAELDDAEGVADVVDDIRMVGVAVKGGLIAAGPDKWLQWDYVIP